MTNTTEHLVRHAVEHNKGHRPDNSGEALFSFVVDANLSWQLEGVMKDADFRQLLESCTTLSRQQRDILRSVLGEQSQRPCQLYGRLEQNFTAHPRYQQCNSDDV